MEHPTWFYQLAADGLVIIHLLFILFVICGGLLVLKNRRWALVHLPAALWGALIELTGWYCPLTPLENRLRQLGGETGYSASFVEQYLLPLLYPASLSRGMQITFGLAVIALNVLVYFRVYRHLPPGPQRGARKGPPLPAGDSNGPDNP
jgi:hypothetical protein